MVLGIGYAGIMEGIKGRNAGLFQAGQLCLQNLPGACEMGIMWEYYVMYRLFQQMADVVC